MHLKLLQKEQAKKEKRAEAADDSIRNKNANKITRVSQMKKCLEKNIYLQN